jgi:uncharacterized protein YkwD
MKRNLIFKTVLALGISAAMLLSPLTAMAAETPEIARTKAWDSIKNTLGGIPESVKKIEYAGSVFYLNKDVTESDFLAVLNVGPEALKLKSPVEKGTLWQYPVYIVWNSGKTVLLVHPIIFDYEMALEDIAVPVPPPEGLTGSVIEVKPPIMTPDEEKAYMLSDEYAEAVRDEFYRLLNEHRAAHGLRELEVNLELQGYADIRAGEQQSNPGHTRPDGTPAGSGWYDSKNNVNTRYAENALGAGTINADPINTALGIFSIWKDSAGHNRHMLYRFKNQTEMALGFAPELDKDGRILSGAIFATGY